MKVAFNKSSYSPSTGNLRIVSTTTGKVRCFNLSKNPRFDLEKD